MEMSTDLKQGRGERWVVRGQSVDGDFLVLFCMSGKNKGPKDPCRHLYTILKPQQYQISCTGFITLVYWTKRHFFHVVPLAIFSRGRCESHFVSFIG